MVKSRAELEKNCKAEKAGLKKAADDSDQREKDATKRADKSDKELADTKKDLEEARAALKTQNEE